MTIQKLQKNIEEVLKQDNYSSKEIYITTEPADWSTMFFADSSLAEELYNKVPEKYRNHLISIKNKGNGYSIVLEEPYQTQFNEEQQKYFNRKQEWCNKHGCD